MSRAKDEVGNRYGKLTVIARGENTPAGSARWLCKCSCGNAELKVISANALRSGATKSCGCIHRCALRNALNTPERTSKRKNKHIERLQKLGRAELVGDYIGDAVKTEYRCLVHGEVHLAIPTNVARGHGLKCCQTFARNKSAAKKLAAAEERYLQLIAGRFTLRETYQGKDTPLLHYCEVHRQEHRASPAQINKGKGLKCCGEEKLRINGLRRREQAAIEYDRKIQVHGRAIRVGTYIASDVPIMHLCLEHNERHMGTPDTLISGSGLHCCFVAGRDRHLRDKSEKAKQRLIEYCSSTDSSVQYLGGYTGSSKKAMFVCKVHGQVHPAQPSNILRGGGLICCKRRGTDSISQVFDGSFQGADKNEWLYLHEIKRFAGYLKFGISDIEYLRWETDKKKEYGEQVCAWWFDRRIDAYIVEQAVFYQTERFWDFPSELEGWAGYTEIRKLDTETMVGIIEQLVDRFHEVGQWEFMLNEIPLTPTHRGYVEAILKESDRTK